MSEDDSWPAEWQRVIVDAYMSGRPVRYLAPRYSRSDRVTHDAALLLFASLSGQSIRFVGHDADKYEAEVLQRLRRMTGVE